MTKHEGPPPAGDPPSELAASTGLIHHPYRPPAGYRAVPVGVHKGSTVLFENVAALRSHGWLDRSGYTYGLHGTPTSFTLEARLASLEGASHVILAPSGLAAIALVHQALLGAGDVVVLPDNVYAPNRNLATNELARWSIEARFHDPMQVDSLERVLDDRVAVVWIEAPGSVTLEFPDIRGLVAAVRARAPRAVIAMDVTWSAGLAYDAYALGADLTIHALTKYPSGGADVLMGSVATRSQLLYERLAWTHSRLGLGVAANDLELVLRGLPSLALRYAAQDASARQVAAWALHRGEMARVLHPPTPGSPGHAHWAATCKGAASLVTLEFDARHSGAQVDAFVDGLSLFGIGWSWAGPMSLAVPYRPEGLRRVDGGRGLGQLVRLSIGLEDPADLIADLERSLAAALA
jgi:cystathionine beta-lyase